MIRSEELRRWNWVNGNKDGWSKNVQVYRFDDEHIQHTDKSNNPVELKYFSPIPLTEEWLLKFGFKNYERLRFSLGGTLIVDLEDFTVGINECDVFWFLSNDIMYVHQLQNLYFALTGEELVFKQ